MEEGDGGEEAEEAEEGVSGVAPSDSDSDYEEALPRATARRPCRSGRKGPKKTIEKRSGGGGGGGGGGRIGIAPGKMSPKQIDAQDPDIWRVLQAGAQVTERSGWELATDADCVRLKIKTKDAMVQRLLEVGPPSEITCKQYVGAYISLASMKTPDFHDLATLSKWFDEFEPANPAKRTKNQEVADYIIARRYPALNGTLLDPHGAAHKCHTSWASALGWLGRFLGRA